LLVNQLLLISRDTLTKLLKLLISAHRQADLIALTKAKAALSFIQEFESHKDQMLSDAVEQKECFMPLASIHLRKFMRIQLRKM
jgi:hypothetical protein